ncbi:MAG: plasmid mobilization protein [Massilia sp.]
MENSRTRKDSPAVKVYYLPDERARLQAKAAAVRMSMSNYMLHVTLGYGVRGVQDHRYIVDLIRVSGDLGRLDGLFKLWLTNEERVAMVGESRLRAALGKIDATQNELRAVIREQVLSHTVHQEL